MPRASATSNAAARPHARRGPLLSAASVLALLIATASMAGVASADPAVPYKDSNAVGLITLCDQAGNVLTQGSVDSAPFVWSVHTDVAGPASYGVAGRTAVLAGYQPRQGVEADEWSGKFVSTVARYTDAAHPTVQETSSDLALSDLVLSYPPQWDHLLQLRVYLGAPGLSTYTERYAALDLRISDDGKMWSAVERGTASCHVGSAVSLTTLLNQSESESAASTPAGSAAASAAAPSDNASSASAPAEVASVAASSRVSAVAVPTGRASSSSGGSGTSEVIPAQLASGAGRSTAGPESRGGAIAAAFVLLALVSGGWGGTLVRSRGRIRSVPQHLHRELESR